MKEAPLDTPLGIMTGIQKIRSDERRTFGKREQCSSVHVTRSTGSLVFCTKYKGHVEAGDPEHRGYRKRWTDASDKAVDVGNANELVRAVR